MLIFKIIIYSFIFLSCSLIGMLISKKYSNRVNELKEFKNALNMFEVKINFSFETIPEIFNEIAEKINGVAGKIFSDTIKNIEKNSMLAGEAWETAVQENGANLKKDDISCIQSLGKLLGKTDVDGQVNQIQLVCAFLDKQINDADEEKHKNEKMYQKLGAIVGLMLVIVLI